LFSFWVLDSVFLGFPQRPLRPPVQILLFSSYSNKKGLVFRRGPYSLGNILVAADAQVHDSRRFEIQVVDHEADVAALADVRERLLQVLR
jgi:hypothetical protein